MSLIPSGYKTGAELVPRRCRLDVLSHCSVSQLHFFHSEQAIYCGTSNKNSFSAH